MTSQEFYCGSYGLAGSQRYGAPKECLDRGFRVGYRKGIERGWTEAMHLLRQTQDDILVNAMLDGKRQYEELAEDYNQQYRRNVAKPMGRRDAVNTNLAHR